MLTSKKKYKLDSKKMHFDILKKLNTIKKPQRFLTEKINVSRATLYRMSKGKKIDFDTFLILLNWLEESPEKYITEKNI